MQWQVLFLTAFDEDLRKLCKSHGMDAANVERHIQEQFEDPFKAERIEKLLTSGVSTSAVDRLATSRFPPSIRLQIVQDLRVTAWCFPAQRQAVVTYIFHKSEDPNYKRAVETHDSRLKGYVESLNEFIEKKRPK